MKVEWNSLTFMEQLSHIAGDVKRCIDSRISFEKGESQKDYSDFYYQNVEKLILLTIEANGGRGREELQDELGFLKDWLEGKWSEEYILKYWNQYSLQK